MSRANGTSLSDKFSMCEPFGYPMVKWAWVCWSISCNWRSSFHSYVVIFSDRQVWFSIFPVSDKTSHKTFPMTGSLAKWTWECAKYPATGTPLPVLSSPVGPSHYPRMKCAGWDLQGWWGVLSKTLQMTVTGEWRGEWTGGESVGRGEMSVEVEEGRAREVR